MAEAKMRQAFTAYRKLLHDLPIHLRALGVAVVSLLVFNIIITTQLHQDISSQQELIHESYQPIRQVSSLRYAHLALDGTLENGSRYFNQYIFSEQVHLLEQSIDTTVAASSITPYVENVIPPQFDEKLQKYATGWNNIRPLLLRWSQTPTNNNLRQILLESSEQQDGTLVELGQIAEANYQQQLTSAEVSTRQTLNQLTFTATVWALLVMLFGINSLGVWREQRRSRLELLQAKEAADIANQAKSAFLSNMSHEMRTPLNAIIGLTDLAFEESKRPLQREYLQSVKDSSQDLLLLIDEVLNMSQAGLAESESPISREEQFSPAELVATLVSQFATDKLSPTIQFHSKIDSNVPAQVVGDRVNLRAALQKLIDNAIKFSSNNSSSNDVSIHVSVEQSANAAPPNAHHQTESPITLAWRVQDSGIGIPPEQHERIFEPFQQVDNSSTRQFGGTGLGLSTCKQLVELINGRISVQSEEQKGSTFTIITPMMDVVAQAKQKPVATVHAAGAFQVRASQIRASYTDRPQQPNERIDQADDATYGLPQNTSHSPILAQAEQTKPESNLRILLVEDTPLNQKLVSLILERSGFQFEVADNGVEAVEKYKANNRNGTKFDLILMDLQMPQMNGFDATKAIRAAERLLTQQVPIIALTANAVEGVREKCLQVGMNEYLTKPIRPEILLATIKQFVPTYASGTATPQG